jgi:hypothetical protein
MEKKRCKHCGEEKELNKFSFRKDINNYRNICNSCRYKKNKKKNQEKCKAYYENNKNKILKQTKSYRETHQKELKEYFKKHYIENKNKIDEYKKKYYEENKNKVLNHNKKYRLNNSDKIKKHKKNYRKNNKEKIKKHFYSRLKKDINFKLIMTLRSRINQALKNNYKKSSTVNLLGCSIPELKQHLELQFTPEMTWQNYGYYWVIDHILPCAEFDLRNSEEQEICFAWWNLQPLEKIENLKKGTMVA